MSREEKETHFMCERNLSRTDKKVFSFVETRKGVENKKMVFHSFGRRKVLNVLRYRRSLSCAEMRESLINDLYGMKTLAKSDTHFLKYTMQFQ